MKAWRFEVDDGLIDFLHAETRNKAQAQAANLLDITYIEARVRRAPVLDDLPITDFTVLMTRSVGLSPCDGCDTPIYPPETDGGMPYWYRHDPAEGRWITEQAVLCTDGSVFCSKACADKFRKIIGNPDMGDRRWIGNHRPETPETG